MIWSDCRDLKDAIDVPLVLHGTSSVEPADIVEAVRHGIGKINLASILKQTYFQAMIAACRQIKPDANPYEIIGSGLPDDVLTTGRLAMRKTVEEWMQLIGSAGKAEG